MDITYRTKAIGAFFGGGAKMKKEFGTLLRSYRERSGKSMGQLARHLEVSVASVSNMELQRTFSIDLRSIIPIAKYLDLSDSDLNKLRLAAEALGSTKASNRLWRTSVRVVYVGDTHVDVCVPGYDHRLCISLPKDIFPPPICDALVEDFRLYAWVNIGAERPEDLVFCDWKAQV